VSSAFAETQGIICTFAEVCKAMICGNVLTSFSVEVEALSLERLRGLTVNEIPDSTVQTACPISFRQNQENVPPKIPPSLITPPPFRMNAASRAKANSLRADGDLSLITL
jgi:hypothetical protein